VDTKELRTRAITQAANAGDPEVIKELTLLFSKFAETGDDSVIPADLVRITYPIAVKHGGRAEYDAVKAITVKPKTPSIGISAILALCSSKDLALAQETWDHVMTKVRDTDLIYYFIGLRKNPATRRFLTGKFRENYDVLMKRLEGNFGLQYLVQFAHESLSTRKDYEESKTFFADKDTSKYSMTLQQALDSVLAKATWIERSTDDIRTWLEAREKA